MSFSFEARFAPTHLSLRELLARLTQVLDESRIDFTEEVYRLHSRAGAPTVLSVDTIAVDSLASVAELARRWFGVSLACISRPLFEALGRTSAMEVYVNLFRSPDGPYLLGYSEAKSAFQARADDNDLAQDLYALMLRLCEAIESDVAIYDEEPDEGLRIPGIHEVEGMLGRVRADPRPPGFCLLVGTQRLGLKRARELAGERAHLVRLVTSSHLLFPFLG